MMEDFDIIQRNFHFKPDEIFPRIKISLLVSLMCESVYLETDLRETKNVEEVPTTVETAEATLSSYKSSNEYSILSSTSYFWILLIIDILLNISEKTSVIIQRPYLLLDVRDPDQFMKSHIIMAENYPKTLLSRVNYETHSLLKYVSFKMLKAIFTF